MGAFAKAFAHRHARIQKATIETAKSAAQWEIEPISRWAESVGTIAKR